MLEIDELKRDLFKKGKTYKISHCCFYFAREVLDFVKNTKIDRIHYSIFDQLIRSSTSIGANLSEGRAGSSKRDWKKFHVIVLKSANETKYWLCLIRDSLECDQNKIKYLIKEADEISNIIASIILNSEIKEKGL